MALIIFDFCWVIMQLDVPDWFRAVLCAISSICCVMALIIWIETKDRIRSLEKRLDKMKGGE